MEEKELTTTYRLGKGPFAGDLIIIADLPDGRSFSIPIPFAELEQSVADAIRDEALAMMRAVPRQTA